ncbi:pre-B-cell leukemia homeobox interacting protein 1b isoform X2 [Perca flavescens]|uniref:pre-B-cell leukemia homeobox interacting protein 1b isoform X2 n=1 Tax=Perca flavescens TaxID=8167 RepID=UPI00106E8968|nr:pre-B-cell leukemia transcription factor-interacting protein 1 isoform X2 [Perca flavescens]
MSGASSANNSWTLLTPEESVAETLRPLAEGTEHHEEGLTCAASVENQPANSAESAERLPVEDHLVPEEKTAEPGGDTSTEQHTSVATPVIDAPVASSLQVSGSFAPDSDALSQSEGLPEAQAQSSRDPDSFSDSYTHITPSPDEPQASLLSTETLGGVEFTQEKDRLAQQGTLHTLNGEELQHEGEESDLFLRRTDLGKQAVYLVDQLVMELFRIWARRLSGEAVVDSPVDSEVGEERTEKTDEEAEARRRRSLLAALERIGRTEEEEEGEEVFQLPQREEDSGFSVNKCILVAVILLGLGTIFFSGFFMDLDEESDYGTMKLKDAEVPGKQKWLNPEVPPPPVDADSTELLNKLAEENQQISVLQAQLQAQKEELKVAKGQAAEGAKERLRWEEVEKENSRLKKEMASLPVLQKENERMKRELESVLALQRELETLRSTVTELKLPSASEAAQAPVTPTTSPSSGQPEDSMQDTAGSTERRPKKTLDDQREKKKDVKKDEIDMGEKKEWKERDKSEWKEGEKKEREDRVKTEWKKGKHEQGKFDKEKDKEGKQKKHSDETKQWKEKDWKKEKATRGDEGKPWKDREGKKEWIEKSERKEEEKDWKKAKHEKVKTDKQWKGKEKDWKVGKDHGEKHKGKEEWKGEKEWKKGKDGFKESGKEEWEEKDWKEKGEKKEWKRKDSDWKNKNGKDHTKEGKGKGERKQWEERKNGKERKGKDERKQWNENERKRNNGKDGKEWKKKDERKQWEKKEEPWKRGGEKDGKPNGDRRKDGSSSEKHKDEHKRNGNHGHKAEHVWGDGKPRHTHRQPSVDQPEYWVQQRDRLQHNPRPPQPCDSLETCAQAEGLLPVPFPEFEAILQTYLAKAQVAGVDRSKREELRKLAAEFFKDGLFVHDQTSFQEFVEDLGDILEDMVEGDDDAEEEDSAIEEEMEGFEIQVMKKFSVPEAVEKKERSKGDRRKESGRGRG